MIFFLLCLRVKKWINEGCYVILIVVWGYKIMISLGKLAGAVLRPGINAVRFNFSKDAWKNRDEASEKVYISEQERDTLKKLLKKVEQDEEEWVQNNQQFEGKFRDILRRHKIDNEPFFSQVSNLHKMLSD